jgi:hypothetical protein
MNKIRLYALRYIDQKLRAAEDNLIRARSAFRGLSDEKLDENYGLSDKTRRQILADYQAELELWQEERKEIL